MLEGHSWTDSDSRVFVTIGDLNGNILGEVFGFEYA